MGLLILLACLATAWGLALFEREVVVALIGVDMPPLSLPDPEILSAWRRLVRHLRRATTRTFSRDYLLEKVWGSDYDGLDRAVDTQIVRLRRKLGALGDQVEAVWGVGYRFRPEPAPPAPTSF